jgi:X-Pro dipeptidyl-peptidase C-terminal non-catalytic domain/X-Pro dipeptidyl-peptidase (S15 family)
MSRIRQRWLRRAVLCIAVALAAPSAAQASGPQPFGHSCTLESTGVRFCPTPAPTSTSDQRVRSWDGAPLQVDVTLPATGNGPWPTIVMLPGYGGSDGVSWEASTDSSGGNEGDGFSNVSFAKQGYAVVTMNFRGVGYSCGPPYAATVTGDISRTLDAGPCRNVAFEFGDQRYDARDVQWVLGLLVDQGIAKAKALGVTGESLGSLVTLELALLYNRIRLLNGKFAPWKSPNGVRLHISAAYPFWAVADLMDGVVPNGRFLSFKPKTAVDDDTPVGAIKLSAPLGIAGEAPEDVSSVPSSDGFDLFADGAFAELAAPDGPGASWLINQIRDYHQSVGMPIGSGVSPLLVEDGWDDLLVNGAAQALRLVDYLKDAAPRAKVALQLADVGHAVSHDKAADLAALDQQGTAFLNHYLQGRSGGPKPGSVTAYTSTCPASAPSAGPYVAKGMAALDPGAVRFSSAPSQTVASGGDPSIGPQLDPIIGTAEQSVPNADPQCQTFNAVNWPGTAVYTHPVSQTFTMLGLPTMRMHVATVGDDGQIDARLWDVAPDGSETYVSSGVYALTNNQTGTITWQMWGGGHTFQKGDTIRVELLAEDVPLERPSPSPFALSVSNFTIELPSHEPADGGEIVKPVLGRS